ncbi:MAG: V-type ATP synthase subunit A [Theionarchaea archaeon]|nr:V-type ATP synthase subunit A [Theionarchaea archaeon]MBU7038430.1 V-type ATP synthase subunit A [Theionarchaea archaeon]
MIMGTIIKVSGPVVVAEKMENARMYDVCRVADERLIGEIIELRGDKATIQVYEETAGLGPGDPVESTGKPLSVELGPGMIESIYDGIQRPLDVIRDRIGPHIKRGIEQPGIDRKKKWEFQPLLKKGQKVVSGDILGVVQEGPLVSHRILIPIGSEGEIEEIFSGTFTVEETVATLDGTDISMLQKWPVRKGRPYKEKLPPSSPLVTGQRIVDTFFPMAKGGTACCPGPFGSGKTVTQHQLAKWAEADIIFFVGCGERGNEMAEVLREFPGLQDPKSGEPLMKRTVLVANTSDMPVAAREASIYTGITLAEYFRDMGYSVALMADSTSRWAEALREISGRLEEMPGEEGYPAYLASRLAEFYERAGKVVTLGSEYREGSLSVIGAVSPPGGDFSEPVTQATLRITKVFWGLDARLAFARHFPAIDWLQSYSLYLDDVKDWWTENVSGNWRSYRDEAMRILQEEAELEEIVRLVGVEALSNRDRLLLETAKSLREDFLHQNAYHEIDTYTSSEKQFTMLELILDLHHWGLDALGRGAPIKPILELKEREDIAKLKFVSEEEFPKALEGLRERIRTAVQSMKGGD